jgi:hypothetical protein
MEELILPTHRQIKKAIRFMPWGEINESEMC